MYAVIKRYTPTVHAHLILCVHPFFPSLVLPPFSRRDILTTASGRSSDSSSGNSVFPLLSKNHLSGRSLSVETVTFIGCP